MSMGTLADIARPRELPLHVGVRDVRLLLQDGRMRDSVSGAHASTARRANLDIPFAFGR
ncbi:MAG TPA: hypothetical protein VKH34_06225 [Vicinamibacterales bacterium]|nr:hypothetical protein [Vicinamibacterales bacterium]